MTVDPNSLTEAVERMQNCVAAPISTEVVSETFADHPAWEGIVHVFELDGHPEATRAYAWSSPVEGSTKRRFFAVLHIPSHQ